LRRKWVSNNGLARKNLFLISLHKRKVIDREYNWVGRRKIYRLGDLLLLRLYFSNIIDEIWKDMVLYWFRRYVIHFVWVYKRVVYYRVVSFEEVHYTEVGITQEIATSIHNVSTVEEMAPWIERRQDIKMCMVTFLGFEFLTVFHEICTKKSFSWSFIYFE